MYDLQELRAAEIQMFEIRNADETYTIFYDETNNIRKLRMTSSGLNVGDPDCFVLGGLATKDGQSISKVDNLMSSLNLQKSVNELKLKHLAKGDFLKMLTSRKLEKYLLWLNEQSIWIHFHVLDPLYWSIVDTVDSLIEAASAHHLLTINRALKNDLYEAIYFDLDHSINLFRTYEYPDVKALNRLKFIEELHGIVDRSPRLEPFNKSMLLGLIKMAQTGEALEFIEGYQANELIDSFSIFYARNIRMYENSEHLFDNEDQVADEFKSGKMDGCINPNTVYKFVDSKSEIMIQMSDAIAGLLGKYFTYLKMTRFEEMAHQILTLEARQLKNLSTLCNLIERSDDESNGFSNYVASDSLIHKHQWIMKSCK